MKKAESDYVYLFLAGLNQAFDELRSRILGKTPLTSLRETFSEVKREETRRKVMLTHQESKSVPNVESSVGLSSADEGMRLIK